MFIAFIVICILGVLIGAFVFFLGLSLLSSDIKRARLAAEKQQAEQDAQPAPDTDSTAPSSASPQGEVPLQDAETVTELTNEELEENQKLYEKANRQSPLPYLFAAEGAGLFVASVALFAIKMLANSKMTWYVLLACFVGFVVISFVVDCLVMSYYIPASEELAAQDNAQTDPAPVPAPADLPSSANQQDNID